MNEHWILDDDGNLERVDLLTWALWFERPARRRVAETFYGDVRVSTVFLGLDHSFGGPVPVLWETMVFGGVLDGEQYRYTSVADARAGHQAMCERVSAARA